MNRMSKTEIPAASGTNITSNASAISTAASSSTAQRTFLSKYRLHKKFVAAARVLLLVVFLSVWELTASHQIIDSFIFSSPSKIARCFLDMVADRSIFLHLGVPYRHHTVRNDCQLSDCYDNRNFGSSPAVVQPECIGNPGAVSGCSKQSAKIRPGPASHRMARCHTYHHHCCRYVGGYLRKHPESVYQFYVRGSGKDDADLYTWRETASGTD